MLTAAGCRVEVCTLEDTILDVATIKRLIGKKCDGVIGQLTEARLPLGSTQEFPYLAVTDSSVYPW